jgi:RHS repeat-associated protein
VRLAGDRLLVLKDPFNNWEWALADGLDSVRGMTTNAGAVLEHRHFEPYGELYGGTMNEGPSGFTGEWRDSETELYDLRARMYSPRLGSFASRDPLEGDIRFPLSLNLYAYVRGNVANYRDPSGLQLEPELVVDADEFGGTGGGGYAVRGGGSGYPPVIQVYRNGVAPAALPAGGGYNPGLTMGRAPQSAGVGTPRLPLTCSGVVQDVWGNWTLAGINASGASQPVLQVGLNPPVASAADPRPHRDATTRTQNCSRTWCRVLYECNS